MPAPPDRPDPPRRPDRHLSLRRLRPAHPQNNRRRRHRILLARRTPRRRKQRHAIPQLPLRTRHLPPTGDARRQRPEKSLPVLLPTRPPRYSAGTHRLQRRNRLVRAIRRLRQSRRRHPRRRRLPRPTAALSGAVFRC
ncbi:hypothetical protein LOY48_08535 [Pseudomonas siliginis]|nr:hypothetical protein LOY48_08535 [Pseudomonas siliginis]